MFLGYLTAFVSGIAAITNIFVLLHVDAWSEIPFMDASGNTHRIYLPTGGLFFLTLLKILGALITVKWGLEAIRTYKPIVREIEHEVLHGVSQEPKAVTNVKSINIYRSKVVKFILCSFTIFALSILYGRRYFTDVAFRFIDDEYDAF
jgi:hypothetical protein